MDIYNALCKDYNLNVERVNEESLNTVVQVEIPVFNTLSSLPKHKFVQVLNQMQKKAQHLAIHEQSLILTLLTDVLMSTIKYNYFFETYDGDNLSIIDKLLKQIKHVVSLCSQEENTVIQSDICQMEKYAQRINQSYFNNSLTNSKLLLEMHRLKDSALQPLTCLDANANKTNENKEAKPKNSSILKPIKKYFTSNENEVPSENMEITPNVALNLQSTTQTFWNSKLNNENISTNKENGSSNSSNASKTCENKAPKPKNSSSLKPIEKYFTSYKNEIRSENIEIVPKKALNLLNTKQKCLNSDLNNKNVSTKKENGLNNSSDWQKPIQRKNAFQILMASTKSKKH